MTGPRPGRRPSERRGRTGEPRRRASPSSSGWGLAGTRIRLRDNYVGKQGGLLQPGGPEFPLRSPVFRPGRGFPAGEPGPCRPRAGRVPPRRELLSGALVPLLRRHPGRAYPPAVRMADRRGPGAADRRRPLRGRRLSLRIWNPADGRARPFRPRGGVVPAVRSRPRRVRLRRPVPAYAGPLLRAGDRGGLCLLHGGGLLDLPLPVRARPPPRAAGPRQPEPRPRGRMQAGSRPEHAGARGCGPSRRMVGEESACTGRRGRARQRPFRRRPAGRDHRRLHRRPTTMRGSATRSSSG